MCTMWHASRVALRSENVPRVAEAGKCDRIVSSLAIGLNVCLKFVTCCSKKSALMKDSGEKGVLREKGV